jgi:glycosyltransferase involved in cell wall biosynthesis
MVAPGTPSGASSVAAPAVTPPWFAATLTVRNNGDTIARSLATLLPQVDRGGELSVADAESTDDTVREARRVTDGFPRFHLVSEPCNRGRGRNLAVALTTAPIVLTHLDADNLYTDAVVRRAAEALRDSPGLAGLNVVGRNDPNPSSTRFFAWRREALSAVGGYPETQLAEDLGLVLRVFRSGQPIRRLLVPRVAEDLKPRGPAHGSNLRPWQRRHVAIRAAKKFAFLGYSYGEFVRYLWITRRTGARFVAGVVVAAFGYVSFAASGRSDRFLRDGLGESAEEVTEVVQSPEWPHHR